MVLNEIASITILVACQIGNETVNQIIPLKVYQDEQRYKAIPLITNEERKITGLPSEISFEFVDYRIIPGKELKEENMEAVNNIVRELRMLRIV